MSSLNNVLNIYSSGWLFSGYLPLQVQQDDKQGIIYSSCTLSHYILGAANC